MKSERFLAVFILFAIGISTVIILSGTVNFELNNHKFQTALDESEYEGLEFGMALTYVECDGLLFGLYRDDRTLFANVCLPAKRIKTKEEFLNLLRREIPDAGSKLDHLRHSVKLPAGRKKQEDSALQQCPLFNFNYDLND